MVFNGILMGFLWDVYGIFVVVDSGRPIFGIFIFMGFCWILWDFCFFFGCLIMVGPFLRFLWDFCRIVWDFDVVFASGGPYRRNSGILGVCHGFKACLF